MHAGSLFCGLFRISGLRAPRQSWLLISIISSRSGTHTAPSLSRSKTEMLEFVSTAGVMLDRASTSQCPSFKDRDVFRPQSSVFRRDPP